MRNPVSKCRLFVPGDSPDKIAKAFSLSVNAIVVDWEDAILSQDKAVARTATLMVLSRQNLPVKVVIVRMNPVVTEAFGQTTRPWLACHARCFLAA